MSKRLWLLLPIFLVSCRGRADRFPYGKGYTFVNRWGDTVRLDSLRGRTLVVTYFYTHCPDACPLTMGNLKRLYATLPEDVRGKVLFVAVSLDPERDTPPVLREYARLYRIDSSGWLFLTGDPKEIRRFIREVGVIAVKGKVSVTPRGDTVYFLTHTDYVHVVSPDGRILYVGDGERLDLKKARQSVLSSLP